MGCSWRQSRRLEEIDISVKADAKVQVQAVSARRGFQPTDPIPSPSDARGLRWLLLPREFCPELIQQRLSDRHGSDWWSKKVPNKIQDNVQSLKKKESQNKYLATRSAAHIGYTFFGNLGQIIIANSEDFSDLFPDQAWINSRFNDLEFRIIMMHTNVLPTVEIRRIDQIIRDWQTQVG